MAVADRTLNVRVRRQLVTWTGIVELERIVRLSYPVAPGMSLDLSGHGIPDRATVLDVRQIGAPNPENPDQMLDVEIVLAPERGDGTRQRVAEMGDWRRMEEDIRK